MRVVKSLVLGAGIAALTAGLAAAAPALSETDLNVRAGPGTEYEVIGVIPAGSRVEVAGCTGSWCQVNFRGGRGFASASYLQLGGGAGVAVAPAPAYGGGYAYEEYDYGPSYGYYDPGHGYYGGGVGLGVTIGSGHSYGHHGWRGHRDWNRGDVNVGRGDWSRNPSYRGNFNRGGGAADGNPGGHRGTLAGGNFDHGGRSATVGTAPAGPSAGLSGRNGRASANVGAAPGSGGAAVQGGGVIDPARR